MKKPQPLWNKRVLRYEGSLTIADLHIGFERELEEKGVNLPSQTPKMIDTVCEILKDDKIDRLIIDGDLKHNIPEGSWQEYKEIPSAIDRWLKEVEEIHLIPGNHDGNISKYTPSDVIIHEPRGMVIEGIGYLHGHARPSEEVMKCELTVLGHTHPSVTITDSLGKKEKMPCWIRLEYGEDRKRAIILPTYNELLGGISVNEEGYIGPFLNDIDIKEERIYLLDGTYLGSRDNIGKSTR